jgi:arginine utilization regulatory protein
VRIIATINEPAEKLIGDGRLRSDLYYRLNVVNLDILPLRDRKEDIAVLADAFLLKHSGAAGKNLRIFSDESIDKLMSYDYPGNVRELENVIISAVTMSGDEYMMPAQSIVFRPPDKGGAAPYDFDGCETLPEYIDSVETAIIDSALEKYGGNYTKTAGGLGINRQALQYKLNKRKRKGE